MRRRRWLASAGTGFLAALVLYLSITFGSTVAAGADQFSYVTQAGAWLSGSLHVQQDIVRESPWPGAAESWTPLGYRPVPGEPWAIASVYPAGLPLLMALFQAVGGYCAAFLVVPCCAALTVWVTYLLGRRLFDPPAIALVAAVLLAASPVFLYQIMSAMSDVPVTAAWTLALLAIASRQPVVAGAAMAAVIVIRPNLAPLAGVLVLWAAIADRPSSLRVAGVSAIGVAAALWVNWRMYGSPLTSGYGDPGRYYAWANGPANLVRYPVWLLDTQTPLVLLAALPFIAPRVAPPSRVPRTHWLLGGAIAAIFASYLFYTPFDAWWFLRFLLPMWPALMVLTAASLVTLANRWSGRWAAGVVCAIVAVVAVRGVVLAKDRYAFDLGRGDRRYVNVARFVADHTEPDAVILSRQHSGSIRHYTGRLTLRFDMLDRAVLDRAIAFLRSKGRHAYLVVDGDEAPMFRERFVRRSRLAALDWSPLGLLASPEVLVYDLENVTSATAPLAVTSLSARYGWRCTPPYSWPPLTRMK